MFWYDHDMGWWGYAGLGIGMVLLWALIHRRYRRFGDIRVRRSADSAAAALS